MNLNRSAKEFDSEILRKYRPPAVEAFFMGFLRTLQVTCLLGGFLYAIAAIYGKWPEAGLLPFGIFAAHLFSYYRGMWLEELFRPNHLLVTISEMLALVIAIRIIAVFFGYTESVMDVFFALDMFFICLAWGMGRGWIRNYFYLQVQPYEVADENEAVLGRMDSERVYFDHSKAYNELKSSWNWSLGFLVALVLIGISLGNYYGTVVPVEEFRLTLLLIAIAGIALGLPILALMRLRFLRTRWRVNRLQEPARLPTRWHFYLLTLSGFAIVVAFGLAWLGSSGVLRVPDVVFGSLPKPRVEDIELTLAPPVNRTPPPVPPPGDEFIWPDYLTALWALLTTLLLAAIVSAIIFVALQLLLKAGWVGPRYRNLDLFAAFRGFLGWVGSLFGKRRTREGFENEEKVSGSRPGFLGFFRRERMPDDPRGKVRYQYKRMAERASRSGIPRRTGQTPHEYAGNIDPALEEPLLSQNLDELTRLYEEARYSPHPINEEQANQAKTDAEQLAARLRQQARQKQKPEIQKNQQETGEKTSEK
jgi:hypothetical protein